ncbi:MULTISPECIES: gamma-glutamylcyclotransferase [unclassified Microcoleus]|uniref:allophanate hydrolase-related protein n=1 Tax=unclassified Microcoleus TaxID=2642155 RepID=UPI0025CF807E|nr:MULTISPECIES: gamma-glutamylcyclotransferase [unclassified Microcoleus]
MSQTAIVSKRVFICGSALRGQPDNSNLGDAKFIREAKTRPIYRLHSAENGWHPAIYEVATGGVSIPGEVYELTVGDFEQLAAGEPPHMYPSDVILDDGEVLTAFLYPRELVEKYEWEDISDRGGWAAYKAGSQ